jgi:hypothetical protein
MIFLSIFTNIKDFLKSIKFKVLVIWKNIIYQNITF